MRPGSSRYRTEGRGAALLAPPNWPSLALFRKGQPLSERCASMDRSGDSLKPAGHKLYECPRSSVGQSSCLLSRRSHVRVVPGAPLGCVATSETAGSAAGRPGRTCHRVGSRRYASRVAPSSADTLYASAMVLANHPCRPKDPEVRRVDEDHRNACSPVRASGRSSGARWRRLRRG